MYEGHRTGNCLRAARFLTALRYVFAKGSNIRAAPSMVIAMYIHLSITYVHYEAVLSMSLESQIHNNLLTMKVGFAFC